MSLSSGWYSLAEAQFRMHRYSDSAASCSQGILIVLVIILSSQNRITTKLTELGQKRYVQEAFK